MKAATVVKAGCIEIQKSDMPTPGPGEVLIRMEGCGLCASNIPPFEGRDWFNYPLEKGGLGHEGWGIIEKVGKDVKVVKAGDRVSALSYHAFAEFDVAPESQVVKLPDSMRHIHFPGEPLGCAMNIFGRSEIKKGQQVAIIGIGFLGGLLIQLAKDAGAEVIAISRRKTSLEMSETLGADHVIPLDDHYRIIEKVKEITRGRFCDRVIEATGKQWPLDLAGELTGIRKKLIIAGYHQDGARQVNMQLWNWRGIDVINAHERDPQKYIEGITDAIKASEQNVLNPLPLFTHTFSFDNIQEAFETHLQKPEGFIKSLILFN